MIATSNRSGTQPHITYVPVMLVLGEKVFSTKFIFRSVRKIAKSDY